MKRSKNNEIASLTVNVSTVAYGAKIITATDGLSESMIRINTPEVIYVTVGGKTVYIEYNKRDGLQIKKWTEKDRN